MYAHNHKYVYTSTLQRHVCANEELSTHTNACVPLSHPFVCISMCRTTHVCTISWTMMHTHTLTHAMAHTLTRCSHRHACARQFTCTLAPTHIVIQSHVRIPIFTHRLTALLASDPDPSAGCLLSNIQKNPSLAVCKLIHRCVAVVVTLPSGLELGRGKGSARKTKALTPPPPPQSFPSGVTSSSWVGLCLASGDTRRKPSASR